MRLGTGWVLLVGLAAATCRAQVAGCDFTRGGSRTVAVKRDAVRNLRWAVIVDCAHPEWPARLVPLADKEVVEASMQIVVPAVVKEATPLVVKAGETVRVWSNDGVVNMETMGMAQESGGVGERIRVRMLRQGIESTDAAKFVTGTVSGAGSVEIRR